MSRKPGLGSRYLETHTKWHRAEMRPYSQVNGVVARLPRFYKDKIFSSIERQVFARESLVQADSDYWDEIDRLQKFHADPQSYFQERISNAHDVCFHDNSKCIF